MKRFHTVVVKKRADDNGYRPYHHETKRMAITEAKRIGINNPDLSFRIMVCVGQVKGGKFHPADITPWRII